MATLYIDDGYLETTGYFQRGITVEWGTRNIFVPRSELTLVQSVPTVIYNLDLDVFRLELKALEASAIGMSYPDTHSHNTTVSLGGVTLARVIEIINGYTVTFEDGQYAVNLIGANSNVADVVIVNQVSVRAANSAGLQVVTSGSGLSPEQDQRLIDIENDLAVQDTKIDDLDADLVAADGKIDGLATDLTQIPADVWGYER